MAASRLILQRCQLSSRALVAMRPCSSNPATSPSPSPPHPRRFPLLRGLLHRLSQRFYDIDDLLNWWWRWERTSVQKTNVYYGFAVDRYGPDTATAFFILSLRGAFRFVGHSKWHRTNHKGKMNWDFLNHQNTPLEEVDMSHTLINYSGLLNLAQQQYLRTLILKGCPEVDDWFLASLHVFQNSLEELDISHCPRITIGGLAALRNLKGLRRLDISSLPRISNPGLVIILLEEMLPQCHVVATGYDLSLR